MVGGSFGSASVGDIDVDLSGIIINIQCYI
jgi:hypothetical protein